VLTPDVQAVYPRCVGKEKSVKRLILCGVLAAFLAIPLNSVFAAKPAFPPGLQKAMEATTAAFQKQLDTLTQRHDESVARLEMLIQDALLAGDLRAADRLEEALARENEQFDRRIAQIQAKLTEKQAKFQAKIDAWIAKHGDPGTEEPPPPPPDPGPQPQ
jgi:hypothetical protein